MLTALTNVGRLHQHGPTELLCVRLDIRGYLHLRLIAARLIYYTQLRLV